MTKFTTADFEATKTAWASLGKKKNDAKSRSPPTPPERPLNSKRQRNTEKTPGYPAAPPSLLYADGDDAINTETFPDINSIPYDNADVDTEVMANHCPIHCKHEVCGNIRRRNHGFPALVCNCSSASHNEGPTEPTPGVSKTTFEITYDTIRHVHNAHYDGIDQEQDVTINITDCTTFVQQLKAFEGTSITSDQFRRFVLDMELEMPGPRGVNAAFYASTTFFQGMAKYFSRSISLHGKDSKRTVQMKTLRKEIEGYLFIHLIEFMQKHVPGLMFGHDRCWPHEIALANRELGALGIVWSYWMEHVEILQMVLQHVDVENRGLE